MNNREQASAEYEEAQANVKRYLRVIERSMDKHEVDFYGPVLDWGYVGDIKSLAAGLGELATWCQS